MTNVCISLLSLFFLSSFFFISDFFSVFPLGPFTNPSGTDLLVDIMGEQEKCYFIQQGYTIEAEYQGRGIPAEYSF